MGDPLSLMRNFVSQGKEIVRDGDKFIFDSVAFSKTARTNFQIYGSGKDSKEKEYYSLESLNYFLNHLDLSHPQYIQRANAAGMQLVTRVDRNSLLNYLRGNTDDCPSINLSGPMEFPVPVPTKQRKLKEQGQPLRKKAEGEGVALKIKLPITPFHPIPNVTGNTSLSEAIGMQRINELKAKRKSVLQNSISGPVSYSGDTAEAANAGEGRLMMNKEQRETLDLMSHEIQYSTRNSILCHSRKEFYTSTAKILNGLKVKQERIAKYGLAAQPTPLITRPAPPKIEHMDRSLMPGYSRYDQEAHVEAETDEFHIDPLKTFSTNFVNAVKETLSSKPVTKPKAVVKVKEPVKRKKGSLTPIIIVPEIPLSLITMLNAKEMLQDLHFVTHTDKKVEGVKHKNEILIYRNRGEGCIPYRVVDLPEKLHFQDWDQVVAVFVTGKSWQFKGWPMGGNPIEICSKICAFHLKYDDADVDANVKQWAVNIIQISRNRRHLDKAAFLSFWKTLDEFIAKTKPYLRS